MSHLPRDGLGHQPMAGSLSLEPMTRLGCGEMKIGMSAAPLHQGLMDLGGWNGVMSHGQGWNTPRGLGRDCQHW